MQKRKKSARDVKGPKELVFRKTNDAIGLRVREGRLTLLSRKMFNVMVLRAQSNKLGEGAPIDTEVNQKYYWMPMSEMARDASFDSKDTEVLKKHLSEMQDVKVIKDDEKEWVSERLIASVKLINTAGINGVEGKRGTVWLGYTFPPEVHDLVMEPRTYTKISIYYQGLMRSGASLALYEICRRYASNPSHMTNVLEFPYWYSMLTGNPVKTELQPYKYFKRDVIKPSIAEINAITDIEVELIEHRQGRKVVSLQFEVHLKSQPDLKFPPPPLIDSMLLNAIEEFGISPAEAQDLYASHDEIKIQNAIEVVKIRMASLSSPEVESPAAYFKWALKSGAIPTIKEVPEPIAVPNARNTSDKATSPLEKYLSSRSKEALKAFKALPAEESNLVMDRFRKTSDGKLTKAGTGIESRMTASLLGRWYAFELWGEPTADDLDRFISSMSNVDDSVDKRK